MTIRTQQQIAEQLAEFARKNREIEAMKAKLAETHGLERNERFDIAWNIAWDIGHACGIDEVGCYFDDLVPLIKAES